VAEVLDELEFVLALAGVNVTELEGEAAHAKV